MNFWLYQDMLLHHILFYEFSLLLPLIVYSTCFIHVLSPTLFISGCHICPLRDAILIVWNIVWKELSTICNQIQFSSILAKNLDFEGIRSNYVRLLCRYAFLCLFTPTRFLSKISPCCLQVFLHERVAQNIWQFQLNY